MGAESVSHPDLLECSLQIMGREEIPLDESTELLGHILLDSTRILGHTPSPLARTLNFCTLAKTLADGTLGEGVLSETD